MKKILLLISMITIILSGCTNATNSKNSSASNHIDNKSIDNIQVNQDNNSKNNLLEGNNKQVESTPTNKQNEEKYSVNKQNESGQAQNVQKNISSDDEEEAKYMKLCTKETLLKTNPEDIYDLYYNAYPVRGEVGEDNMAQYIGQCFKNATDNKLANNNELKTKVDKIRELYEDITNNKFAIEYIVNGGGTMYIHGAARSVAYREFDIYWYTNNIINKNNQNNVSDYDKKVSEINSLANNIKNIKMYDVEIYNDEELKNAQSGVVKSINKISGDVKSIYEILNTKDMASIQLLDAISKTLTIE